MGHFFQAEDGIRDVERSRGLGDVYKRQDLESSSFDQSKNMGPWGTFLTP